MFLKIVYIVMLQCGDRENYGTFVCFLLFSYLYFNDNYIKKERKKNLKLNEFVPESLRLYVRSTIRYQIDVRPLDFSNI